MNNMKSNVQPCLKGYKPSFKLIQASSYGAQTLIREQKAANKRVSYPVLRSSKEVVAYLPSRKETPALPSLTYVNQQLALIKDPLWKRVCADAVHLMGPIALQIFQVQFSLPQDHTLDLYCHTEEISRFLQCYNFVVLESLKRYFPTLKQIRVNRHSS